MNRQLKYNEMRLSILEHVARSGLKVGDKLPPERELLTRLDCSIATVRSALQSLADEGFIRKVHGVGSFLERTLDHSPISGSVMLLNITRFPRFEHIAIEGLNNIRDHLRTHGLALDYIESHTIDSNIVTRARGCLGILLYGWVTAEHAATLRALKLPMLLVGNVPKIPNLPQIRLDNAGAIRLLAETMIRRGCRRLALLNAPDDFYGHVEFAKGFREALTGAGLECRSEDIVTRSDETYIANLREFFGRIGNYDGVIVETGNLFPFLAANWKLALPHKPLIGVGPLLPEQLAVAEFVYDPGNEFILSTFTDSMYLKAAQLLTEYVLLRKPLKSFVLAPHIRDR